MRGIPDIGSVYDDRVRQACETTCHWTCEMANVERLTDKATGEVYQGLSLTQPVVGGSVQAREPCLRNSNIFRGNPDPAKRMGLHRRRKEYTFGQDVVGANTLNTDLYLQHKSEIMEGESLERHMRLEVGFERRRDVSEGRAADEGESAWRDMRGKKKSCWHVLSLAD
ncbi:hypothetical protein K438DRAFT_1760079 [Mycena galopus ATCC 62051]|nr:hypothetical protein K438DRAFT_1760079 [Mycena galopus ATCC 62051]